MPGAEPAESAPSRSKQKQKEKERDRDRDRDKDKDKNKDNREPVKGHSHGGGETRGKFWD